MASGFLPLAVSTCLDVFRDVSVHPGPPKDPPQKLDYLLLFEVFCHFAVIFRFENCGDHLRGNVEASSVVEYVV